MSPKLRLLLGIRWDDADPWGSETSPRADLGYRISDTFELRAGYGKAYRPPSVGELYFPFSGNPDLQPETSTSADLGFVYTTRDRASQWQVTAFSTDLENLIEFDYSTYANANIGSAAIRGAEMSWSQALGRRGASIHSRHLPRHRGRHGAAASPASRVEWLVDHSWRIFRLSRRAT